MKIHRFIGDFNISKDRYVITEDELIHQIWNVLKLRPGEEIRLFNGHLQEYRARIVERNSQGILVLIESQVQNESEPQRTVKLFCAVLKKENFELVCQKATEVGVSEIIPIVTDRTVKLNLRSERLEKIIKESAEQ